MTPTITVVLPTFNGHHYLRDSVESCVGQTYQDWELIIVDDCSTDSTPQLIDELVASDPRIKSARHAVNRKLPAALNTGFRLAKGHFLTWTSDDNLYRPTAFERMMRYLDAHQAVDFVYSGMTIINDAGDPLRSRPAEPPHRLSLKNPVGACFLYRRKVYEALGDYEDRWFLTEDYDYWLRVSGRFKMAPLDDDLYLYRDHGKTLTNSNANRIECLVDQCFEHNFENIQWCGKRLLAERCIRLAQEALRRGDVARSRQWLRRACRTSAASTFLSFGRVGQLLLGQVLKSRAA